MNNPEKPKERPGLTISDEVGHCRLHPLIATPKACSACFDTWPAEERRNILRPACKRKNWKGRTDTRFVNQNCEAVDIETMPATHN